MQAANLPFGDVIADAQLDATNDPGFGDAVVAFMNPGGIRTDLAYAQQLGGEGDGNVTYGEMFNVQPFGNSMVTMTLTGAKSTPCLNSSSSAVDSPRVARKSCRSRPVLPIPGVLSAPACNKVDPSTIKINGVTVDPSASTV